MAFTEAGLVESMFWRTNWVDRVLGAAAAAARTARVAVRVGVGTNVLVGVDGARVDVLVAVGVAEVITLVGVISAAVGVIPTVIGVMATLVLVAVDAACVLVAVGGTGVFVRVTWTVGVTTLAVGVTTCEVVRTAVVVTALLGLTEERTGVLVAAGASAAEAGLCPSSAKAAMEMNRVLTITSFNE